MTNSDSTNGKRKRGVRDDGYKQVLIYLFLTRNPPAAKKERDDDERERERKGDRERETK